MPVEFEKLGTYKLDYTVKLTRATLDGDEDCDPTPATPPVNQSFCATDTYTFPPWPDGGAGGGGRRRKFPRRRRPGRAGTIVAVNNGPDEPSGGAKVTGLPKRRR